MYVEREIKEKFGAVAKEYGIVAIVGPRQAGKTTFLKERIKETDGTYVMLDDPDARELFDEDVKKFEKQYLEKDKVIAIDEAQYGMDAGRKLKYLADEGRKVWVSSSSQTILGKDVLSWLVGRVSILRLYPFSLSEFLSARGQRETTSAIIRRAVWEQMTYGGYPKVVLAEAPDMKKTMLKDLYETMILKDVAKTFSIQDVRSLEEFSKYLAHSIGGIFVYEKAAARMGFSFQTAKKYLNAMEKSYFVALARPFCTNKLKELAKQPKIYFIDTGLRNAVANDFQISQENEGKLFENCVFCEIKKIGLEPKYWRTKGGAEVDFVVEKEGKIIPIEAKFGIQKAEVERSLMSFIAEYSPKLAIVVFYKGKPAEVKINGCRVVFTDITGLGKLLA